MPVGRDSYNKDKCVTGGANEQEAYLVGKTHTSTEADTPNDEHGQVLGKGTQDGTDAEGSASKNHDQLPATKAGDGASEKAEESTCIKHSMFNSMFNRVQDAKKSVTV